MKTNGLIIIILIMISMTCFASKGTTIQEEAMSRVQLKENSNGESRDLISDLIDTMDQNNLEQNVQDLVDFDTRYYAADNKYEVASWLHNKFLDCGLSAENVVTDSFYIQDEWHRNIYGIIPGTMYPDKYILVSGHYDSISETPMTYAPGADDDASAISAILESARVMIDNNFQPDVSIMFTLFGSKEPGRYGSEYLTDKMILEETDLLYAINLELLGYNTNTPDDWTMSFNRYSGSEFLYEFIIEMMEEYTSLNAGTTANNFNFYDCWNFYQNDFNVVMFTAEEFNSSAHSSGDIIDNIDFSYMTELSKLACASITQLSLMPQTVNDISILDDGSGNGLFLTWSASTAPDFDHYEIGWGTESGEYEEFLTTSNTEISIDGLTEGQVYFIGIAAVDTNDNRGFYVENEATSFSQPQIPNGFLAVPTWDGVQLSWLPNQELDIEGYNVFRSDAPEGNYEIINSELLEICEFLDETTANCIFYYYKVKAVDLYGNESEFTNPVRSRIISLDQGILLIDDTIDGNGNYMQPTDEECDSFYENILNGFSYDILEATNIEKVNMDDMCAYSTVIWYIDDNLNQSNISASKEDVALFLDAGGKLFLSGFRPVTKLSGIAGLPVEFDEGDFAWDYLNLQSINYSNSALFNKAVHIDGDDIHVDESKTPEAMNYHLMGVEGLVMNNSGVSDYTYGTEYELGTPFSELVGMSVNTAYFGEDYKLYILTFPLFYMQEDEVTDMMSYILTEKFNEMSSSDNHSVQHISGSLLKQNYPNPFNPETNISFDLKDDAHVNLEIYNVKGQRVKQIINSQISAGKHSVVWNGKDDNDKTVSSGINFYKFKTEDYQATKKMLLLK